MSLRDWLLQQLDPVIKPTLMHNGVTRERRSGLLQVVLTCELDQSVSQFFPLQQDEHHENGD